MRSLLLLFATVALTACGEGDLVGPSVRFGERFTLAVGEAAMLDRTGMRLQFVRVSGDSRCPVDVVCIQGGDAIVHVTLGEGTDVSAYELHTGDASRTRIVRGRVRIDLLDLQPYPFSSRVIAPGDYRATFTASGS